MHINITYDVNFTELMLHLKSKYGQKLFDLDGIGSQLDIDKFSKGFFINSSTTADVSVDSNSNVSTKDMIVYNTELPKPYFRMNAYYLIWKKLRQLYGHAEANRIIEMQLTGDFYINDLHGVSMPYSYHPHTTIIVRFGEIVRILTMEKLFLKLNLLAVKLSDRETIDLSKLNIKIFDKGVWVNLKTILRHKSHTDLVRIETKRGGACVVTEDHPVILSNGSEKVAADITEGDELMHADRFTDFDNTVWMSNDEAYIIGAMIGDGYSSGRGYSCCFVQKNVEETHYIDLISRVYGDVKVYNGKDAVFGNTEICEFYKDIMGRGALNKHLPYDFACWNKDARFNLLAGLVDTDGTINKRNGVIDVRLISFGAIQQIAELANSLGATNIRTAIVPPYTSNKGSYKSIYRLYKVSFRLDDDKFIKVCRKAFDNVDIIKRVPGKDGGWDSEAVNKIDKIEWKSNWVYDVTTETGTFYSNGLTVHNCYNYSTYDIALAGLTMVNKIKSIPPKHLYSFKSQLEQFVVLASNSTLGAVGLADWAIVTGYYVDKILETKSDAGFKFETEKDCWKYVKENIVSFIYTINQPSRSSQSPFTNISLFDDGFLNSLAPEYVFSDGKVPKIGTIKKIQELFIDTMNDELRRTPVTFPVTTACFSVDDEGNVLDEAFLEMISEKNMEYGFINIYCGKTSTLSSCCRLRSDTNSEYFNSFGSGSSKIGSLGVVTVNLPRLAYRYKDNEDGFFEALEDTVEVVAKVNNSKRHIIKRRIENGAQPLYDLGFMDINKQYSTCGLNGINEAITIMGYDVLHNGGVDFGLKMLDVINTTNDRLQKQYKAPHNCEQTPSENSSIKLANKDKLLGIDLGYNLYSNQFIPLTTKADLLDRIKLQGIFDKHFSGGCLNVAA